MASFKDRLDEAMRLRDISAAELSRIADVNEGAISQYRAGKYKASQRSLDKLARALHVNIAWLMGADVPMERTSARDAVHQLSSPNATDDVVTFRVNADIAAGYDQPSGPLGDWDAAVIDIPVSALHGRTMEDYFVIRIKGNSMYPHYQDGDFVLVLKTPTLERSGQVGVMLCDDEGTIKKIEYEHGEDWLRLIPFNPEYAPRVIEGADLERCRVIGVPKMIIRTLS